MFLMRAYVLVVASAIAVYILRLYRKWRKVVGTINDYPGYRNLFIDTFWVPFRIPYIVPGKNSAWTFKRQDFDMHRSDIISLVHVFPTPAVTYHIADAEATKYILSSRQRFPKPTYMYQALALYGGNIMITEGDEWKRHRRIAAPPFSERNTRLVWDITMNLLQELSEEVWGGMHEIIVDHVVELTKPLSLYVFGAAGYGQPMSWSMDRTVPQGHSIPLRDAMQIVTDNLYIKLAMPDWILDALPFKHIRNVQTAYRELEYMIEMIQERKQKHDGDQKYDLLNSLLQANQEEANCSAKLSDSELLGDVFMFLVAGHETMSHTLAYALILLALHHDKQEIMFQHIRRVLSGNIALTYEQLGKLTYCSAVFMETLRLFPSVIAVPKLAEEDTVIVTRNSQGESQTLPCPKGTLLVIHTVGLHYNPRYWKDPTEFVPERFLEDWPRDAFLPFSSGSRACLGRSFSETEAVAALTYLTLNFKIEVKEEPQYATETFAQRKERLLKSTSSLTLFPLKSPLVFKRR